MEVTSETDCNMNTRQKKIAPKLSLAAILSGTITIVISIVTIALCLLALVIRYDCDRAGEKTSGCDFFMTTLYRAYIQDDACPNSLSPKDITKSYSVFVLTLITLCLAVVSLEAGVSLIITSAFGPRYISVAAYINVGVSVAVLVVDLTFASQFGMDYITLKNQLNEYNAGACVNYEKGNLRLSALLLMSIVLKGYVFHFINIVILVCLIIYVVEYQKGEHHEHEIFKMEILNSSETSRVRQDEQLDTSFRETMNNSNFNHTFTISDAIERDRPIIEITSPSVHSGPWLRVSSSDAHSLGSRVFARHQAPRFLSEPSSRQQQPSQPPVPAADYNPSARRVKFALQSGSQ